MTVHLVESTQILGFFACIFVQAWLVGACMTDSFGGMKVRGLLSR